jgi:hypothetical protein
MTTRVMPVIQLNKKLNDGITYAKLLDTTSSLG